MGDSDTTIPTADEPQTIGFHHDYQSKFFKVLGDDTIILTSNQPPLLAMRRRNFAYHLPVICQHSRSHIGMKPETWEYLPVT